MNDWKVIPDGTRVHSSTNVEVYQDHNGKPVLKLSWGTRFAWITVNQAEMIGAIAHGAILRYEDLKKEKN